MRASYPTVLGGFGLVIAGLVLFSLRFVLAEAKELPPAELDSVSGLPASATDQVAAASAPAPLIDVKRAEVEKPSKSQKSPGQVKEKNRGALDPKYFRPEAAQMFLQSKVYNPLRQRLTPAEREELTTLLSKLQLEIQAAADSATKLEGLALQQKAKDGAFDRLKPGQKVNTRNCLATKVLFVPIDGQPTAVIVKILPGDSAPFEAALKTKLLVQQGADQKVREFFQSIGKSNEGS